MFALGHSTSPRHRKKEAVKVGAAHIGLNDQAHNYSIMETCFKALPSELIVTYQG